MDKVTILVAKDFSITPGSRYKEEGKFSGEEFRENVLEPKFKEAIEAKKKLLVNLDGTLGYGTSFLEEAFGGLARQYGPEAVLEILEIVSKEEPYLSDDITSYVENAKK